MKWFNYSKNKIVYERPAPEETGLRQNPDEDPEKEPKEQQAAKDRSLRRRLQVTPCAATHRRCSARVSPAIDLRRLCAQRYLLGLREYLDDPWNCNDALSLLFVTVAVVRMLTGADSGLTALVSTFGTLLLWVRMHYGPDLTLAAHPEANTWCSSEGGQGNTLPPVLMHTASTHAVSFAKHASCMTRPCYRRPWV